MKNKVKGAVVGMVSGFLSGLFGSGGGIAVVEGLERTGSDEKTSHATSLAVIFPVSVLSATLYSFNGYVPLEDTLWLCGGAVAGGILGAYCLKRVSVRLLNNIFTLLMLASGLRMLF